MTYGGSHFDGADLGGVGKGGFEVMGLSDWLARQGGGGLGIKTRNQAVEARFRVYNCKPLLGRFQEVGWVFWMGGCGGGGARQMQKGGRGRGCWLVLTFCSSRSFFLLLSRLVSLYRLVPREHEDVVYPRRVPQLYPTQKELVRS